MVLSHLLVISAFLDMHLYCPNECAREHVKGYVTTNQRPLISETAQSAGSNQSSVNQPITVVFLPYFPFITFGPLSRVPSRPPPNHRWHCIFFLYVHNHDKMNLYIRYYKCFTEIKNKVITWSTPSKNWAIWLPAVWCHGSWCDIWDSYEWLAGG